ncbi:MAG: sensor histidine kinase [Bacteroidetes bacterium]|nr:MAG: sensor histidine kinase [Bacteroidota bacterium]
MRLRSKLAWQFTILVALALLLILGGVYFLNLISLRQEFFNRLEERAKIVAYFYWEKEQLKLEDFKKLEQRYVQRLPYETVRLYDKEHKELLVENFHPAQKTPNLDLARLKRERTYFAIDNDYIQVCVMLYTSKQGDSWVAVSAYDLYGNKRMQNLLLVMGLCYLGSLGFIFLLGRFLVKNGLRHIQNIVREVQTIQADHLEKRLALPPYQDEVGELVFTFNQLLARLEKNFQSHKMFVSQASHELRTPLAIMLGEVEVALARPRTIEVHEQTLQSIRQTLLQAKEMVDSLLLFAQLEHNVEVPNIEALRIDELLWEVFDSTKREYPQHYWRVDLQNMPDNMEELTFFGNRQWIHMAIHNLMQNVIKYGNNQPADITLAYQPQQLLLRLQDYGCGINAQDLPYIFEPFYRGTNIRGAIHGTGIGLALVKRALDAHGIIFRVSSEENKGTVFELFFEL